MKKNRLYFALAGLILLFLSCSDMDEHYKDFLDGGEIIYPGRVDSVKVHPGNLRVQLEWLLLSDPNIVECKVIVDHKTDNPIKIPIERTEKVDTIRTFVENLTEGIHVFDIYSLDKNNNVSVKVEVHGSAYGVNFNETLTNRRISKTSYSDTDQSATITWNSSPEQSIGVEVRYTNTEGEDCTVLTKNNESVTILTDFLKGSEVKYKTRFVPEDNAVDIFYSPENTIVI